MSTAELLMNGITVADASPAGDRYDRAKMVIEASVQIGQCMKCMIGEGSRRQHPWADDAGAGRALRARMNQPDTSTRTT
jgi:hypothetical protein